MSPRILLQLPGMEITLFRYKRDIGMQQVSDKVASLASGMFDHWEWCDGSLIGVDAGNAMIIAVEGPGKSECFL